MILPDSQYALVVQGPGSLQLLSHAPVPSLGADQVLIEVKGVALNPSDWKMLDTAAANPGTISGGDFAGVVVACGREVTEAAIGDRLCGFVFGAASSGAFAQFVMVHPSLCFRIPPSMSFEAAASLGLGLMTGGLMLQSLHLNPLRAAESTPDHWVLVYGGSTATGTVAIQLLRYHGYRVITTCSPRNFELVRRVGAVATFDYTSPTCKEDIRAYTGGTLMHVMDCIADSRATTICYGAIGEAGGRYCALNQFPAQLHRRRASVSPEWIHSATIFGGDVQLAGSYYRRARPEDREFAIEWARYCTELLAQGKLQPHPLQVQQGGLARVVEDLVLLRNQQITGKKLVYPLY
ncbi:hypothetical protein AnigIFM62618_003627 [Aspergillus niger]|nr:hypothetical protein AnigIFM62618_003627 [Aspergillus niger]